MANIKRYCGSYILEINGNMSDILPPLKEAGASCSMTLMSQA